MPPYSSIDLRRHKFVSEVAFIDIRRLFVPLRFDFLVRVDFLKFYEANRDLYVSQRSVFMEQARTHLYFFQHTKVKVENRARSWTKELQRDSYERRVEVFVRLYESMRSNGFNKEHAITLHRPRDVERTDTGKLVVREFYIGDGWHRLACLHTLDIPLREGFFEVKNWKRYAPRDNTAHYLKHGQLSRLDYIRFLSLLYKDADEELRDTLENDAAFLGMKGIDLQRQIEDYLDGGEVAP